MKRAAPYIITCAAALLLLFRASAQNGTLKGRVQGREGALEAATVAVGNKMVLTDKQGRYTLSLRPGSHTLVVTHSGYLANSRQVNITEDHTLNIDILLTPAEEMDEAVVTGTRSVVQRSTLNTPVPVDVFSSHHLQQTGQPSLTQMLNFSAPSFNASRQVLNEPVTLRGLYPDQVLILLNNTRYHNMAWINTGIIRGHLGKGSVANDLNAIPLAAIEKIEILRDGASAHYGSDAIAGVINVLLKESTGKTAIDLHLGEHYKGDGETVSLGVNHGLPLRHKGFLNLSGDFRYRHPTARGGVYRGTVYYHPLDSSTIERDNQKIRESGFDRKQAANNGTTRLRSAGLLANGAWHWGHQTQLFWTGALNRRTPAFSGGYRFPKFAQVVNKDLYPHGFRGVLIPAIWNISGIAGAKGRTPGGFRWEYSSALGNNTERYEAEHTNNASQSFLGKQAPTSFYTGTLISRQLTNNLHLAKSFSQDTSARKSLNLALGAEWRLEQFRMKAGEEAAWKNYDPTGRTAGGAQSGLIVPPDNALHENRSVAGTYLNVETEFNDHLLVDLAGRYEYYSDFGSALAGKLAARYRFGDTYALRGSVSNGFRAPSLQQRYFGYITRIYQQSTGLPTQLGIFNNKSTAAAAFGIPSLEAETSVNISAGFTAKLFNHLNLTIDAYHIQIRNRIILSGEFDRRTNPGVDSLLRHYPDIDQVRFFTNAIHTRTRGVDLVLNGRWSIQKANLAVMLAASFTKTRLFGAIKTANNLPADPQNTNTLFNIEEKIRLEQGQPTGKVIAALHYNRGKAGVGLRGTRFGKTAMSFPAGPVEYFSPKVLTDLNISFAPKTWLTLTVGANNIFDVYPDRIKHYQNTAEGAQLYGLEASPFGYDGGYYFVTMAFSF